MRSAVSGFPGASPAVTRAVVAVNFLVLGLPLAAAYWYDPIPPERKTHKVKMGVWGTDVAAQLARNGAATAHEPCQPEGVQSLLVATGGRTVCARVAGEADAPTVLVFHGINGSRGELGALLTLQGGDGAVEGGLQAAAAATGTRIVAVDRPGYGLTSPPPAEDATGVSTTVSDAQAVLSHLGAHRATVVGCSFGSVGAMAFAAEAPGQVAGPLHLLSPDTARVGVGSGSWLRDTVFGAGPVANAALDAFSRLLRLMTAGLSGEALKSMRLGGLHDNPADAAVVEGMPPAVLLDNATASLDAGHWGLKADLAVQMTPLPHVSALPSRVQCEVLLVRGEDDQIVPGDVVSDLQAALPHSTLRVLPGQGHLSTVQRAVQGALTSAAQSAASDTDR